LSFDVTSSSPCHDVVDDGGQGDLRRLVKHEVASFFWYFITNLYKYMHPRYPYQDISATKEKGLLLYWLNHSQMAHTQKQQNEKER
jgi:hypothetical protein